VLPRLRAFWRYARIERADEPADGWARVEASFDGDLDAAFRGIVGRRHEARKNPSGGTPGPPTIRATQASSGIGWACSSAGGWSRRLALCSSHTRRSTAGAASDVDFALARSTYW
jgi:hypothetical protein